jgi:DNA-binding NarL/FixJ family response regulator
MEGFAMSDLSYTSRRRRPLDSPLERATQMSVLRTFIVEDSSVIRESLIAALEEMVPLKVIGEAEDGPTALRWLDDSHNACDLVIIDIFLRMGSGMDVLRALDERKHAADRVVLTNYATPDIRSRCAGLGASRVFDKSSEIDELVEYCLQLANGTRSPSNDGHAPER